MTRPDPLRRALLATPALVLMPATLRAAEPIGAAVTVRGEAHLATAAGVAALRPADPLALGDTVSTGADGVAALELRQQTLVQIGPQASLTLDRFIAETGGVITLGGGGMVFDRPDDLPPIDLAVRTAFARIGVRGTRFFAGPSKGVFGVFVQRGSVQVMAGGARRRLGAGEGVDIARPGAVPGPVSGWKPARIAAAFASVGLRP